MRSKPHFKDKINVITLGCAKNIVDSEVIVSQLKSNQFEAAHQADDKGRNIIIINTCGFIDRAKEESVNTILEYAEAKEQGKIDRLFVTGCLSQRYRDELKLEIPEVDDWFGTMELPALLAKFNADYKHELIGERLLATPSHFAYLKISEGCNRSCTFCAIPLMRGKHRSRPMEELISEAHFLVKQGVKEIVLIAQELTYYGLDIYRERKLSDLLKKLSDVEGLEWIRLHYAYPSKFPLDIVDVIRERSNICNYLDIPLQHASNKILKSMRRQISREETRELLDKIREKCPDIVLRTTMLVGFPGETEEDMDELMDFISEQQFDRLGVFTYSHEENTTAFDRVDDVPQELKEQRKSRLMDLQQDISEAKNHQKIGRELKVLIDRKEGDYFIGRTEADSPEVDNEVLINAGKYFVRIGDFCRVTISGATAFDLFADPVEADNV